MHLVLRASLTAGAVSVIVLSGSLISLAETLTLEKCEELAAKQSLEALSAEAGLRSQELQYRASQAAYRPSVSLTSLGGGISSQAGGGVQSSPLSAGLAFKQTLGQMFPTDGFLANTSSVGRQNSEISLRMARLDAKMAELDIKYRVRTAYVNYLKARDDLKLSLEQQKRIDTQLLPEINGKTKNGVATKADMLEVESQSRNARLAVSKAEHSLSRTGDALSLLIGRKENLEPLELEQIDIPSADNFPPSLDELTNTALGRRIELKKAVLSLEQAELDVKQTRLKSAPAFTLSAGYGKSWPEQGLTANAQASIISTDMTLNGSLALAQLSSDAGGSGGDWEIGLRMSSPVLDWGQSKAGIQQAEKKADSASITLEQTENSVRDDVKTAYYGLIEAREKLDVARTDLEASAASLSITRSRFDSGAASGSELVDAELALFQAKSVVSQGEYDLFIALDSLAKATDGERSGTD